MVETETAIVIVPEPKYVDLVIRQGESVSTFFHLTQTECSLCYSLQFCVSNNTSYRCADWHACHERQKENKRETPIRLTDADINGLLERMEVQQADMERLKRIEAAALVWQQAHDAFDRGDECSIDIGVLWRDFMATENALIAALKGGE
jgi:hypothetical protein